MPDPGRLETQKVVTLCGYWESNPGLLIEQPAVSTPKPSLQPQTIVMRCTQRLPFSVLSQAVLQRWILCGLEAPWRPLRWPCRVAPQASCLSTGQRQHTFLFVRQGTNSLTFSCLTKVRFPSSQATVQSECAKQSQKYKGIDVSPQRPCALALCKIPSGCILQRPGVGLFKCNQGALGKVSSAFADGSIQVGPEFTGLVGVPYTGNVCWITYQSHLVSGLMLPSGLSKPPSKLVSSQARGWKRGLLMILQAWLALKLPNKSLDIPLALCHPVNPKGSWLSAHPCPQHQSPPSGGLCWVTHP